MNQTNLLTNCPSKKSTCHRKKFFNQQKYYQKVKKKLEETRDEIFFIIIEIREFTKPNFCRPKKLKFLNDPVSRINRLMMIIFQLFDYVNELQTRSICRRGKICHDRLPRRGKLIFYLHFTILLLALSLKTTKMFFLRFT